MSSSPAVSIVMPCHNATAHLPTSVGSILAQTFGDRELMATQAWKNIAMRYKQADHGMARAIFKPILRKIV